MVNNSGARSGEAGLCTRLQKLMFLRVLFGSLLLGASIIVQVRETKTYFGDIQTSHYAIIAAIYFLTFVYAVLLKRLKDLVSFAYVQLLVDTFLVTGIIYVTGGIESIFSFLYILTIINGSIMLYRRGGMAIASSSSILYGLLLDLHYYGVIEPIGSKLHSFPEYKGIYIFYMILVNVAAFYVVAFLSSYPSEQERKSRAELEARQDDIVRLEALNEWIVRSIDSGLIAVDERNRIILFNPAAEKIFEIESRRAITRELFALLPFLKVHVDADARPLKLRNRFRSYADIEYTRSNGRNVFLRLSISPLHSPESGSEGQILLFHDITAIKRIEDEMKRVEGLAMIGELAAGIAHEIRNPMASISGSIQMLKEGLDKDDVNSRLMDIVLREINRLNHLVDDFLRYARPKEPKLEKVDLQELIIESLELFKNSGKWVSRMEVRTQFKNSIYINSDPEQIKQVLWNLYINASEAMPNGGALHIETDLVKVNGGAGGEEEMARIVLRDTGKGFSPAALDHLFTPFFTTKEEGSGLGLAIVKRIVEGLNGKVSGRCHPEGGAEITILLHPSPLASC
ncbi:MAG: PAS domain S-box protein [Deltaproteobacteria bacterium]|nr:PAS domain S-box protein [Deltaproteobacteria bacterium]